MKSKIGKLGKGISVLLAVVMVFTCVSAGFVPGIFSDIFGVKAEASISQTVATAPTVYIVVPETIYLTPSITTTNTAQYYVNNTFNSSTNTVTLDAVNNATTGKYYFKCDAAVSLSVKMNNISAGTLSTAQNITLTSGYGSGTVSSLTLSAALAQNAVSTVEWVFTYTLTNGATMISYAYTTCYAPYCSPVGVILRHDTHNSNDTYVSTYSWISGIHSVSSTYNFATDSCDKGFRYAYTNANSVNSTPILGAVTKTSTGKQSPLGWFADAAGAGTCPDATIRFVEWTDSKRQTELGGNSPIGLMTVDNSRNNNLNTVPNVNIGMLVTDFQGAEDTYYYVADGTGNTHLRGNNRITDGDAENSANWTDTGSLIAGDATTNRGSLPNINSYVYNGVWNRPLATTEASTAYTLKSGAKGYIDNSWIVGDNYVVSLSACWLTVTTVNKAALRNAVSAALSGNYQQGWYTSATWTAYNNALKNACYTLGNPLAAASDISSNKTALENAVLALTRATYTVNLTHTLPAASGFSYNYGGTNYTSNGTAIVITETLSVTGGNHVNYSSNSYNGYTNPNTSVTLYHVISDRTQNINYTAIQSKLSLEGNGGLFNVSGAIQGSDEKYITFGQRYGTLNSPTRLGYTLSGWLSSGGTAVTADTFCSVTNADTITIIYAQWSPVVYNISYNLNGGSWPSGGNTGTASYTINSSGTAVITVPNRTGYSFTGWTVASSSGSWSAGSAFADGTVLAGNYGQLSLIANWTPVNYGISYNYGGGSASNPASYNIQTSFTLTNPTRAGYSFAYWTSTSDGITATDNKQTVRVNESLNQTGAKDYKANWNLVNYAGLTFDAGAGQVLINGSAAGSVYTVPSYNIASHIVVPNASRNYYTLQRWNVTVADGNWETGTFFTAGSDITGKYGNAVLSAVWQAVSYTISYNLAGGTATGTNPTAYNVENAPFTLSNPTREGYTFAGWSGTGLSAPSVNVTVPTGSNGNRTYTATWTLNTYTLTYNNNTGSLVNIPGYSVLSTGNNPSQYTYESADIAIENPSYTAYTFAGWTGTGLTGATTTLYVFNHSTGNRAYTATWTPTTYTYTLNPNGGKLNGQSSSVNSTYNITNSALTLPLPVRNGYMFLGWKPVESSGNWSSSALYAAGSPLGGSFGSVSFTAQWSPAVYTVTLDANGGTLSSGTGTLAYSITSETMLPTASKTGYTFGGWRAVTVSGSWVSGSEYHASLPLGEYGNLTLRAIWTATAYNASFVTSGSAVSNITGYTIEGGIILPVTSKENYVFAGWKPDSNAGNWSASERYASGAYSGKYGTVSFTAQWTPVAYTLVLNGNGAVSPANITYTVEDHVTLPVPERNGYTFGGWRVTGAAGNWANNENYSAGTDLIAKYGNATLTAQWSPVTYTVSYNENGGGELSNTNYTAENTSAVFALPSRTGYTFLYWSVAANSGSWVAGTHYNAGQVIPSGMYENVTLTAVWEINHYTITWIDGNGDILRTDTADHGTTPSYTGATPTKNATAQYTYTFTNWSPAVTPATGDQTYTAQFSRTVRSYTIRWYNESALLDSEVYEYGETPTYKGALPTKAGSYMSGWSPAIATVTGNTDYSAQFTEASGTTYSVTWNIDGTAYSETYPAGIVPAFGGGTPYKVPDIYSSYVFSGWSSSEGGTVLVSLPAVSVNVTYYAVFTSQYTQYKIDFVVNGGNEISSLSYNYGSTGALPVPVKTGYTFTGWTVVSASGNWVDGTALGTAYTLKNKYGDVTVSAGWTPTAYSLTLVYADGVTANGSLVYNIESGSSAVLPAASRNGYLFSGWRVTTAGGSWIAGEELGASSIVSGRYGNAVLTAIWTARSYTLFLDGNSGVISGDITSVSCKIDEQFTLPSVSRTGYDFKGWRVSTPDGNWSTADALYPADTYITGKYGNASLSAEWAPTVYTVTLLPTGGEVTGGDDTVEYTMVGDYSLPEITRTGYTFTGWLVTSASEGSWTYGENIASEAALYGRYGSVTITAQWQVNTYTITWTANGVSSVDSYEYDALITPRTLITRNGYNGVWNVEVPTTMPAENLVINAVYELIDYSIVFNTNGAAPIDTAVYNIESTAALPIPTLDGHTFEGWRVTSAAGNWTMNEITEIGMLLTGRYGTVRLIAQWSVSTHTITWMVNSSPRTAVWYYGAVPSYDGTPSLAPTQSSTYTFVGWSLTENGAILGEIPAVTGDAVYYAVFTPNVRCYQVHWNIDGVIKTETYDYGAVPSYNQTLYGTPVREATEIYTYVFSGWTPAIVTVSGETTYYATFTASAHAQSVSLNIDSVSLDITQDASLTATVNPVESVDTGVTWRSSNPDVASVSADGTVTPGNVGVAVITVTTDDNSHTASCVVTVNPIYTSYIEIYTGGALCSGKAGETVQLSTEVLPYNATQLGVVWSSDNISAAEVTQSGLVTIKGVGKANIKAVTADGRCAASVEVTGLPDEVVEEKDTYTVIYSAILGGSYVINGITYNESKYIKYTEGDTVTFSLNVNTSDSKAYYVTANGVKIYPNGSGVYTINNINRDITIIVTLYDIGIEDPDNPNPDPNPGGFAGFFTSIKAFFQKIMEFFRNLFK